MPKIPPNTLPTKPLKPPVRSGKASKGPTAKAKAKTAPQAVLGLPERLLKVQQILEWLVPVPKAWIEAPKEGKVAKESLESMPCESYEDLIDTWKKALRWRSHMDDVLSVMLAVVTSTVQQGDQLFLMVIGDPGGGKTRFCDGMLISKHCHQLEYLTGFFSGMKDEEGNDYSLINRVNRKCMITPEGDIMMSNPNFVQIMAQQRRIFDGTGGATYKNLKEDRAYKGLRTPWIIAGTPAMMERDQASLGDRFLKVYMEPPMQNERKKILRQISRAALEAVAVTADGEKVVGHKMQAGYQKTGGDIDWLRDNTDLLAKVQVLEEHIEQCEDMAEFIAFMRARPSKEEEGSAGKEEPNRLNHQFIRLMCCLTVVLNKTKVDDDIMRRVKKVAMDTGRGPVLNLVRHIYDMSELYTTSTTLSIKLDMKEETVKKYLRFLKKIGVIQLATDAGAKKSRVLLWGLTPYIRDLCDRVF